MRNHLLAAMVLVLTGAGSVARPSLAQDRPITSSFDVASVKHPGFKAFVVASVSRKAGWVIFMNGDNAGPIIQALVDPKCPINEIFT